MTIVPLNKCKRCGISCHMYLLKGAPDGDGKICKDEAVCRRRQQQSSSLRQRPVK